MNGTNWGDIQYGLTHGKGVFAGQDGEAYFLQPDGSLVDLQGQTVRIASAEGKAIYDAHDQTSIASFVATALSATTATLGTAAITTANITTANVTTENATTVNATAVKAFEVISDEVQATLVEADSVSAAVVDITEELVMYEGTQKYYVKITSGTLAAVGAYLIDLTADEHVAVEIKDGDDVEYEDGDEVLDGVELTVTLTFATGFEKDAFTVNTSAKTSPATHTVNAANVAIVVTSKAIPTYKIDLTADEHVTVAITDGDENVYEDDDDVYNGTELTVTLTFAEGYEVDTFTINTTPKTSPATHTVNGAAIAIVVTSKETT
jgi:hypothetical protein